MVGIVPMIAVGAVDEEGLDRSLTVGKRFARLLERNGIRSTGQLSDPQHGPAVGFGRPGRP
jgi:hypothetical protein